ncbi:hypothetical protein BX666DRAFT_59866 [Dichotomocladium elegans]|nr:hypothetical protein BX666DRAFT_59866 [Dichotomocladium elegans]
MIQDNLESNPLDKIVQYSRPHRDPPQSGAIQCNAFIMDSIYHSQPPLWAQPSDSRAMTTAPGAITTIESEYKNASVRSCDHSNSQLGSVSSRFVPRPPAPLGASHEVGIDITNAAAMSSARGEAATAPNPSNAPEAADDLHREENKSSKRQLQETQQQQQQQRPKKRKRQQQQHAAAMSSARGEAATVPNPSNAPEATEDLHREENKSNKRQLQEPQQQQQQQRPKKQKRQHQQHAPASQSILNHKKVRN